MIQARQMMAFRDELQVLQKEAGGLAPSIWQKLKPVVPAAVRGIIPSTYGKQLIAGTGLGALGGYLYSDKDDPHKVRNMLAGAALGGGGVGGAILATKAGREALKKGWGNWKQRQLYSLTGQGLGEGEAALKKAQDIELFEKAPKLLESRKAQWEKKIKDLKPGEAKKGPHLRFTPEDLQAINEAHAANMKHWNETWKEPFQRGELSAPGLMHGLVTSPGRTIRSAWERGGKLGKTMAGLGALQAAYGFAKTPEEGGPGRLESGLGGLGAAAGWAVAPFTFAGGTLVGLGGQRLGEGVGKLGDRLIAARQQREAPGMLQPAGTING